MSSTGPHQRSRPSGCQPGHSQPGARGQSFPTSSRLAPLAARVRPAPSIIAGPSRSHASHSADPPVDATMIRPCRGKSLKTRKTTRRTYKSTPRKHHQARAVPKDRGPHTGRRRAGAAPPPKCLRRRQRGGARPAHPKGHIQQRAKEDRGDFRTWVNDALGYRSGRIMVASTGGPTPRDPQPLMVHRSRRFTTAAGKSDASGGGSASTGGQGKRCRVRGRRWLREGLPSRPPSTQAKPSRRGSWRPGRSYSGALHLDAMNHAHSTTCGSTADGMEAGASERVERKAGPVTDRWGCQ